MLMNLVRMVSMFNAGIRASRRGGNLSRRGRELAPSREVDSVGIDFKGTWRTPRMPFQNH